MPRLDLKVIVHHGSVIRHRIAGREELVGSDVIVAHRLLKNHVVERLGSPPTRCSASACIAAMGVDPVALGHDRAPCETYDDLGEVDALGPRPCGGLDGGARARRVIVTDRDAGYVFEGVQPAPRDIVWSFMTDPAIRPRWQAGVDGVDELPTAPRRGVGTTNHCMHGTDVLMEEILDWRPTDYLTLRTTLPNGF